MQDIRCVSVKTANSISDKCRNRMHSVRSFSTLTKQREFVPIVPLKPRTLYMKEHANLLRIRFSRAQLKKPPPQNPSILSGSNQSLPRTVIEDNVPKKAKNFGELMSMYTSILSENCKFMKLESKLHELFHSGNTQWSRMSGVIKTTTAPAAGSRFHKSEYPKYYDNKEGSRCVTTKKLHGRRLKIPVQGKTLYDSFKLSLSSRKMSESRNNDSVRRIVSPIVNRRVVRNLVFKGIKLACEQY